MAQVKILIVMITLISGAIRIYIKSYHVNGKQSYIIVIIDAIKTLLL